MLKRFTMAVSLLLLAAFASAQETITMQDMEKRIRDLEMRVQQMQKIAATPELTEVQRQIDILTREIEALKSGQKRTVAEANVSQYGLGAAASKVYRSEPGVSIGGYGEMLYQNFGPSNADSADLLRAVLYTGYKFSDRVIFNSELEVEHANTEHGGTAEMEFAYLDYLIRPEVNVRAGMMLMPVGLVNEQHEPTAFPATTRPVVENKIIPSTWMELGAGVFGDVGRVSYRTYLVTGLNSAGFDGIEGIRGGRQEGAEAIADDWAVVGRADWHPIEGMMLGGSIYSGDSGQRRDFAGRVTLGEIHADAKYRGASLRGLFARGSVGDAVKIAAANELGQDNSMGKSFGGWYVEGAYDVSSLFQRRNYSLSPYVRYERFDTQRSVPAGFARNPTTDGKIWTVGVAFKPVPQTVIKIDRQSLTNRGHSGFDQINIALGYIF